MEENKLARKIKKATIIDLLLPLPLFALAALLIVLFALSGMLSMDGYLKPHTVGSLVVIDEIAKRPLGAEAFDITFTTPTDNIVDTGIYRKEDETTVGDYLAVFMDNEYVFCYISDADYNAIKGNETSYTITGTLHEIEPETVDLAVQQMAKENISESEARDMIYGYYIDTTDNGVFFRSFLYLVTLALLFFGLLILFRSLLTMANVKNYSQIKKLAKYGDVDFLLDEIERDYAEKGSGALPLGKGRGAICLGERWIIVTGGLGVKFMRAKDLQWVYKLRRTTKAYGVVATNANFTLMLMGTDNSLSVSGNEFNVDSALSAIAAKYPWVVKGYSAGLAAAWRDHKDQFSAYVHSNEAAPKA